MMDSASQTLTWMLDELARTPNVLHAAVLSSDGLILDKSTMLPRDDADTLAAAVSSLYSVVAAAGRHFGSGPVQHVMAEFHKHTLIVAAAGHNARLAVLCDQAVDMGTVAYEMSRLVTRIGQYLGSEPRAAVPTPHAP
jgi:predicted regulator of Ras-like GTPase activity (Roadblock/LC7/MglB family)